MNYKVETTDNFKKEAKVLSKNIVLLKTTLKNWAALLRRNHEQGKV